MRILLFTLAAFAKSESSPSEVCLSGLMQQKRSVDAWKSEFADDEKYQTHVVFNDTEMSVAEGTDQRAPPPSPLLHDPTTNPAPWTLAEVTSVKAKLQGLMKSLIRDKGAMTKGRGAWRDSLKYLFKQKWQPQPCQVENTGTCQDATGKGCKFFACDDKENVTKAAGSKQLNIDGNVFWYGEGSIPSAPKFLRLAFHDCMKDGDGTGGCDGCINFEGMFTLKNLDQTHIKIRADGSEKRLKSKFTFNFQHGGNNVGLAPTADVLENLYSDETWVADAEGRSLQQGGKSRADLWALATLVAVEKMIKYSNSKCGTSYHPYSYPESMGLPEGFRCEMSLATPLTFKWGRKDCKESASATASNSLRPYQKSIQEKHPNPEASGKTTAQYFKDNFDFSGRETVAIMGAHGVGDFHSHLSGFRYTWMGRETGSAQTLMLNNLYYRYIAMRPALMQKDRDVLEKLKSQGKALPGPGTTHWRKEPRGLTPGGGPWQWFFNVAPSDQSLGLHRGGTHNTMLNSDIGLYLNFDSQDGGAPIRPASNGSQCDVLPVFTTNKGGHRTTKFTEEDLKSCKQDAESGDGSTLADVVEQYADDQDIWVNDFVPTLVKMLGNGQGPLQDVIGTSGVDIYSL